MASSAVYPGAWQHFIAIGIVLLLAGYQAPPGATVHRGRRSPARSAARILAVIAAGLIWGLFNIGFAIIFSFGPSLLVERGWSITAAGSAISIVLWLSVAQRARRRLACGPLQAAAHDHDSASLMWSRLLMLALAAQRCRDRGRRRCSA